MGFIVVGEVLIALMNIRLGIFFVFVVFLTLVPLAGCERPKQMIKNHSISEWPTYGHDLGNQRFSPLTEINAGNVSRLRPAYVVQTGVINGSFETSPIVSDGTLYLSQPYDGVIAVDAATGDDVWRRPPITGRFKVCCGPVNRGVATTESLVIIGQVDGVLVALDRATGSARWTRLVGNNRDSYSITMAPVIVGNSVIAAVAGSELGFAVLSVLIPQQMER